MGYIFGGNTGETSQSLAEKRKLIEALMKNSAPFPNSTGTGMAYLAQAIANSMKRRKLQDEISQGQTSAQGSWDTLLEGLFSGGQQTSNPQDAWNAGVSAPPQAAPTPQTANVQTIVESLMGGQGPNVNDPSRLMDSFNIPNGGGSPQMWINQDTPMGVPTPPRAGVTNLGDVTGVQNMGDMSSNAPAAPSPMAAGITEAAQALGISPTDLATVISYETGGTFNPMQVGPTTRFGQHKGLIQFGEPQAREYGVDWNNPLASQLGANGAVVKYMRAHGVKPGMGLMDIYSAVNAGAPGRGGWSDAASGGAPGTVADKVNNQMAGHITKANALMGGSTAGGGLGPMPADQPDQRLAGNFDMETLQGLAAAASNPYLPEGQRAIAQMLLQQATQEMFGSTDPMDALQLEKMQLEIERLRNPVTKPTGDIQNYEYYRQQELGAGRQPKSYGEWSIMDEKASIPPGLDTGKFSEEAAKIIAGEAGTVAETGIQARRSLIQVNNLEAALSQSPGGFRAAFQLALGNLGIATEGLGDLQLAEALISQLVPGQRAPGSGTMSDADLALFKASLPRLINTPEGNQKIIDTMRGIAEYDVQMGAIARQMLLNEITPREAFDAYAAVANPLAGFQESISSFAAPETGPVQIRDDADYEALPIGTEFIGPDGVLRRKE